MDSYRFNDSTLDAARLGQFGIIPNQGGDSTTRAAQRGRVTAEVVDQNIVVDPVKGTVQEIPPSQPRKKTNTGKFKFGAGSIDPPPVTEIPRMYFTGGGAN